jgi:hypothetical protein
MRCKNCGREIDNMWGFCPYCGSFAGDLEDSFANIAKMFGGKAVVKQEGDSFIVVLEIKGMRQAFKITPMDVEEASRFISPSPVYEPVPSPAPPEPRKKRAFRRTEEPTTEINYMGDKIYIKMDLSDVVEEDIEVEKLENSVEVRAYKGKTRFFKLVPVPSNYKLVSKEFSPGELFIVLEKE